MLQSISSIKAHELLVAKKAVVLDVREKEEIAFASIGEHLWIPLKEVSSRLSELPKSEKIIVVCRSGSRSASVTEFLIDEGFDAVNLTGGILGWHTKVDKTVRPYFYNRVRGRIVITPL